MITQEKKDNIRDQVREVVQTTGIRERAGTGTKGVLTRGQKRMERVCRKMSHSDGNVK
jgi:hypothetical protein